MRAPRLSLLAALDPASPQASLNSVPWRAHGPALMWEALPEIFQGRVFGSDDRVRIGNTTAFPYRTVCKLLLRFPNTREGYYVMGSGVMIGKNHVLTAGHCVYSADAGGWATSIRVVPGLDNRYMPFSDTYASDMMTFTRWIEQRDLGYDIAVIRLQREVGLSSGWMGLAWTSDASQRGVSTVGYPGEKQEPGDLTAGLRQYLSSGAVQESGSDQLTFSIDITGGQSGSPMYTLLPYVRDGSRAEGLCAVGVVSYENTSFNGAARITEAKFHTISAYLKAGGECSTATGNDMQPGEDLEPDHSLRSTNGRFYLVFQQSDGNLVLYDTLPTVRPLWASGTDHRRAALCAMQQDGNLVIYDDSGRSLMSSGTSDNPGSRLVVQDDGNVVIYRPDGRPVWATNTVVQP